MSDPVSNSLPTFSVISIFNVNHSDRCVVTPYCGCKLHFLDDACMCAKSLQLYLTLCDPMDCSPPGFSVRGILHTRILEWVAVSVSIPINPKRTLPRKVQKGVDVFPRQSSVFVMRKRKRVLSRGGGSCREVTGGGGVGTALKRGLWLRSVEKSTDRVLSGPHSATAAGSLGSRPRPLTRPAPAGPASRPQPGSVCLCPLAAQPRPGAS